jgi:uncharacterized protein DUF4276
MQFVHVLVEGQTEAEFVDVLNEYLEPKRIYLTSTLAKTKRAIGSNPAMGGGIVSYGKVEFDVQQLLHDTSVSLVTTMIDFYGLPTDFPGYSDQEATTGTCYQRAEYLEKQFGEKISHQKFLPYFAIHEFEALLFTKPDAIVKQIRGDDVKIKAKLEQIRKTYKSPEEINLDNPPATQIKDVLKEYKKVAHGYLIAIEIGIEAMRQECPHFDSWLKKLEALS